MMLLLESYCHSSEEDVGDELPIHDDLRNFAVFQDKLMFRHSGITGHIYSSKKRDLVPKQWRMALTVTS